MYPSDCIWLGTSLRKYIQLKLVLSCVKTSIKITKISNGKFLIGISESQHLNYSKTNKLLTLYQLDFQY